MASPRRVGDAYTVRSAALADRKQDQKKQYQSPACDYSSCDLE
jgi:hypothetical protein